jgi:conjugal transfer pilin signal peptidase TrbI
MSKSSSSRGQFLVKATAILSVVLLIGAYLGNRFYLGVDSQEYGCLPFTLVIVDTKQRDIKRGQYFAYVAKGMQPAVEDGLVAFKQAVAVSGDQVNVGAEETTVNGVPQLNGLLRHAGKEKVKSAEELTRTLTIGADQLFAMGTEPASFDSRYWGPVESSQIIGRVYPIY